MDADLDLAFHLADVADAHAMRWWNPDGVRSATKADGSPVTEADVAVEEAVAAAVRRAVPADGLLGEEVGETQGSSGRRWIVDGIDGTRFFAAGSAEWGTLIALEWDGQIVLGLASSPVQGRRWWATRGNGAFVGPSGDRTAATQIFVSKRSTVTPDRVATLPGFERLTAPRRDAIARIAGGRPAEQRWSHQARIAEGQLDVCVWFGGDVWDHAAPSLLVQEAGGRFTDHNGGVRLDTRTAVYSNGVRHDDVVATLNPASG